MPKDVQLPSNVHRWKNLHVLAWLKFNCELPSYLPEFEAASIDGHLLMKFIDDEVLKNQLHIADPIHRLKIMDRIESLKKSRENRNSTSHHNLKQEEQEASRPRPPSHPMMKASSLSSKSKSHQPVALPSPPKTRKRVKVPATTTTTGKAPKSNGAINPPAFPVTEEAPSPPKTRYGSSYSRFIAEEIRPQLRNMIQDSNNLQLGVFGDCVVVEKETPLIDVLEIVKASFFQFAQWLKKFSFDSSQQQDAIYASKRASSSRSADEEDPPPYFLKSASDYDNNHPIYRDHISSNHDNDDGDHDGQSMGSLDPPPIYEELYPNEAKEQRDDEHDEEDDRLPHNLEQHSTSSSLPPAYDTIISSCMEINDQGMTVVDWVAVVFKALIDNANSTTQATKLTRVIFESGLRTLLGLSLGWSQFNSLWTFLDSDRMGHLSLDKFRHFFGDFESYDPSSSQCNHVLFQFLDYLDRFSLMVANRDVDPEQLLSCFGDDSSMLSCHQIYRLLQQFLGRVDRKCISHAVISLERKPVAAFSLLEWKILMAKCLWIRSQQDNSSSLQQRIPSLFSSAILTFDISDNHVLSLLVDLRGQFRPLSSSNAVSESFASNKLPTNSSMKVRTTMENSCNIVVMEGKDVGSAACRILL